MKNVPAALQTKLDEGVTTFCTCFLLVLNFRNPEIASITFGNPTTITTTQAHSLETGDYCLLQGLNGGSDSGGGDLNHDPHITPWDLYEITSTGTYTFTVPIDTTGWDTPYVDGGVVREVRGYTDNVADIELDGIVYDAETAYTPSATQTDGTGSVDNMELTGLLPTLQGAGISQAEIDAGVLDFAEIRVFRVDYTAPNDGRIWLRRGWFGNISTGDLEYRTEVAGMAELIQQPMLELVSPECRYREVGEARCTVDTNALAVAGTVTAVTDSANFETDVADTPSDTTYYEYGRLRWVTGLNAGLSAIVRTWTGSTGGFEIRTAMPYNVQVGDTFSLSPGCDKTADTCKNRFANFLNFGGFKHLPTEDGLAAIMPKSPEVS